MVKADIPSHSRESSPEKTVSSVSSASSHSLVSRTSSSASSCPDTATTISTTRESSPDFRWDLETFNSHISLLAISDLKYPLRNINPRAKQTERKTTMMRRLLYPQIHLFSLRWKKLMICRTIINFFVQPDNPNDSIKQLKHFNRTLKKARSFRAAREKIDKVSGMMISSYKLLIL